MARATWILIGVTACGRVDFDLVSAVDAELEPLDAVIELPRYTVAIPIPQLDDPAARDDDPSATGDLLELYFNSDRAGGAGMEDIYVSRRGAVTEPWGAPALVVELSTPDEDNNPEISEDGLTLFLERPNGANGEDIFVATRASRAASWSPPMRVDAINSTAAEYQAAPASDLEELVLSSTRLTGNGETDIFQSTKTTGSWSTPVVIDLGAIYGPSDGMLSGQDRYLYFHGTMGADALPLVAERSQRGAPFGVPRVIVELDTPDHDTDLWASPDLRTVLLARTNPATPTLCAIYEAHAE